MKILVLSNLYPPDTVGGYEMGCRQAVDALRARGHDVRVLAAAPRTPAPHVPHVARVFQMPDVWDNYLFARSQQVTSFLAQSRASLVNAYNVHALTREIEEFRPDVVYVWNILALGALGLMAAIQHRGVPWLWHLMDDVPLNICRAMGPVQERLRAEFDRQLDGDFLACSRQLVAEIEAGGVRLGDRAEVIPNWVVGDSPEPRERTYRPGRPLRVAFAGYVAAHKGVDLLVEGAAKLREQGHHDFRIDIYGTVDGHHYPSLAHKLDVADHVLFLGPRPQAELVGLYRDYDAFAFPTWEREPFGFAPLEAAWRGCVPLVTQTCGFGEWLMHGVHCVKIERSARGVAESMASIIEGRIDLAPIARRAAAVVDRDFHIDAIVPKIERALARAAARPTKARGSADEAYRLALLAEKLAKVLIQEAA